MPKPAQGADEGGLIQKQLNITRNFSLEPQNCTEIIPMVKCINIYCYRVPTPQYVKVFSEQQ